MAHTAPMVKGRVRPRYRFNIELPDELGEFIDLYSEETGKAKRTIIVRLLEKEKRRIERAAEKAA